MDYAIGSLVQARGREWVVLPDTSDDFLVLRPLGGTDQEIAGIYLPLEGNDVRPATFDPPDPRQVGDYISSRLLRDAVRLGFRSSAGPFRSFASINVEPRPYQLVPLLMALKLDPVRLLVADDVGIGKTIEAGLIAREMLDRGEVKRLAVLCPPHLAEQWQSELNEKFHIQAELVLPSTARRLERNLSAIGQSIFDLYPYVIVSTEYIKAARRRDDFVRTCPEFVIVDEAHTCAFDQDKRSGRHLRHQLVQALSESPQRHLVLVTATPHSGNEGAFRSLLGLLRPDFQSLPQDLSGRENERRRQDVAQHLVQRRRADVRAYMENTIFPEREDAEETYTLSSEYQKLFNNILDYARERVLDKEGSQQRQRVRWWSALALLRSLASSPAAAAATLRSRSGTVETETPEEADAVGERAVLDLDDAEDSDNAPGGQEGGEQEKNQRERLLRFARQAEALQGIETDTKLKSAVIIIKQLLKDGFNPILFCRFIPTAEYVATELRKALPNRVEVAAITGLLPPEERKARVKQLGENKPSVLVATDCLSEGINLQMWFDAVVHYDLSWNPTRHEQREGRVDRFGQPSPVVRTVTYYGTDNQIDGIVLNVLLKKHKAIRTSLGISVPLPANSSQVVQALMQGLLLRGSNVSANQIAMPFMENMTAADLQLDWENVSNREKKSRTLFAQHAIQKAIEKEVVQEWKTIRAAIGSHTDVERFVREVVQAHGGFASQKNGVWEFTLPNNKAIVDACGGQTEFKAGFTLPVPENTQYLSRTHPLVEGLASYTMETSLDPLSDGVAKRCGVIRTKAVTTRTVLLLLRFRYHITIRRGRDETPLLAEACDVIAFRGRVNSPEWFDTTEAENLLHAEPAANITPQQAHVQIERTLAELGNLQESLNQMAEERSETLKEAHTRVRQAARQKGVSYEVRPNLPTDLLGLYILLPVVD